jgi:hypothetical protein
MFRFRAQIVLFLGPSIFFWSYSQIAKESNLFEKQRVIPFFAKI